MNKQKKTKELEQRAEAGEPLVSILEDMKEEKKIRNWEKELRKKAKNSPSVGRCARIFGVEFLIKDIRGYLTKKNKPMKKVKKIKPDKLRTTKEVFGFPFKTFKNSKDLHRQMLEASENTLFLIGENVIKYPGGRERTELVWARVFRTRDSY